MAGQAARGRIVRRRVRAQPMRGGTPSPSSVTATMGGVAASAAARMMGSLTSEAPGFGGAAAPERLERHVASLVAQRRELGQLLEERVGGLAGPCVVERDLPVAVAPRDVLDQLGDARHAGHVVVVQRGQQLPKSLDLRRRRRREQDLQLAGASFSSSWTTMLASRTTSSRFASSARRSMSRRFFGTTFSSPSPNLLSPLSLPSKSCHKVLASFHAELLRRRVVDAAVHLVEVASAADALVQRGAQVALRPRLQAVDGHHDPAGFEAPSSARGCPLSCAVFCIRQSLRRARRSQSWRS